jgi:hypothetical protein
MYRGVPMTRGGNVGCHSQSAVELRPREAEVEQLDAVRRAKHVRRLQIAVHDAARVQRRKRREYLESHRDGFGNIERPALQLIGERLAFEQLHRDEEASGVFADLVDLTDVGMVDAGGRARFAPQPFTPRLVTGQRRQRLQRDGAPEALVARLVDDAHAALAELAGDRVLAETSRHARPRRVIGRPGRVTGRRRRRCRCRPRQPVVQRAQPTARGLVERIRHRISILPSGREHEQPMAVDPPAAMREERPDGRAKLV